MPDLNVILLFIACLSPALVLARTTRRGRSNRGWRLAALAVWTVTGMAWMIAPARAGFVGGGAWFALLFLPVWGFRVAAEAATRQRFTRARRLLRVVTWLHPMRLMREQATIWRALELAQAGERDAALRLLEPLCAQRSRTGLQATAHSLRIAGDWAGLVAWGERHLPRVGLGEEPSLLPLYFRALGETSRCDDLVLQFAGRAPMLLSSPQTLPFFSASLIPLLAFCGRLNALEQLLAEDARDWPEETKTFWRATCFAAVGNPVAARATLQALAHDGDDGLVRRDATQRLQNTGKPVAPLSAFHEATVQRFEQTAGRQRRSLFSPQRRRLTNGVLLLLAVNLAMFTIEILAGGSTNLLTLHRLGALEPLTVFAQGQYWRLLSALFLHFGPLHLLVNLYALYVLGPRLETNVGTLRFLLAYLVAGLGSSAGVLLLWRIGWSQADQLVGASGAIMGMVGLWAGILIGHRHAPVARRQLYNIALIVVLQTAIDAYFPQISLAAHTCGLVTGFVLGLFVAPAETD